MENLDILRRHNLLDYSIGFILLILQIIISLGLVLGIYNLILNVYTSYPNTNQMFQHFIHHTLSLFVAIEIIKSINDYFKYRRIRLYLIIDVSIIILLRELVLGMYQHSIDQHFALTLICITFILILMRVIALKFSPNKYQELER